jgi:acetyl-CoA acetyltransferase
LSTHPYARAAIAAVYNTRQARVLEGHSSLTITLDAARSLLAKAGIERKSIDGVAGQHAAEVAYLLGLGPVWQSFNGLGIRTVLEAAGAISAGHCEEVLIVGGGAGEYVERTSTAPWTRPANEFVEPFGLYTAVEFALVARRHMHLYGTRPEDLATVSALIRNNGHLNPAAVCFGWGPYTVEDILASRMVASPFHLLDCSLTSEGGCAMLMTTAERARELAATPVYIHGAGIDQLGPAYRYPPSWDLSGADGEGGPAGLIGRRAARHAFDMAGLSVEDVDCLELYDPFSFEVIRQLEAFGFCEVGDGGRFVQGGGIGFGGRYPLNTDGGLLSFSHSGTAQLLQRVVRAVEQIQGSCGSFQVPGAEIVLCSNGGAGALFCDVLILGKQPP